MRRRTKEKRGHEGHLGPKRKRENGKDSFQNEQTTIKTRLPKRRERRTREDERHRWHLGKKTKRKKERKRETHF